MSNQEPTIFKYYDDFYYNLKSYSDQILDTVKEFNLRPNNPIRIMDIAYYKTDSENVEEIIENGIVNNGFPIKLYTDQFNLANILVKQYFFNIAVCIPQINSPKIEKDIVRIFNSKNLDIVYNQILKKIANKDYLYIVYTKRFYKPTSKNYIIFDTYLMEKKNLYYIIPQVNIYINYNKIENKIICELSGTIIN